MKKYFREECPYCHQDIGIAIDKYFRGQLPGEYFEFECPNCKKIMNVEVEACPEFYTSVLEEN